MSDLYNKLVDLYAGKELPAELNDQMELASYRDPRLAWEMTTLSNTVEALRSDSDPVFTEESYQRILAQIYAKAGSQPAIREESGLQYQLPIPI